MAFRSLPMPLSLPLFPTRAQIQAYLVSYATTFDLYPYIRFRTTVRRLYQPIDSSAAGGRRWMIEYAGTDGKLEEMGVDYVCCANGHYADGWIPAVPGLR
jgi:cation diffusion facilitator CzcD-associated flavoprotein CzcO